MKETYEIIITGRVQGVGFRFFALRAARAHGICGYARNQFNGSVKVIAQGESAALNLFIEALRQGPVRSNVEQLYKTHLSAAREYSDFHVG
jgi:acylphosphatase